MATTIENIPLLDVFPVAFLKLMEINERLRR
jgi:hypothetical protein